MGETSQQSMNFRATGLRHIKQTWLFTVHGFIVFDSLRDINVGKKHRQERLSRRSQILARRIPNAHANTFYSSHYQETTCKRTRAFLQTLTILPIISAHKQPSFRWHSRQKPFNKKTPPKIIVSKNKHYLCAWILLDILFTANKIGSELFIGTRLT